MATIEQLKQAFQLGMQAATTSDDPQCPFDPSFHPECTELWKEGLRVKLEEIAKASTAPRQTVNQDKLRQMAIEVLNDDHGISQDAWLPLFELLEGNHDDIIQAVEAQDGRLFLPEDVADDLY